MVFGSVDNVIKKSEFGAVRSMFTTRGIRHIGAPERSDQPSHNAQQKDAGFRSAAYQREGQNNLTRFWREF